MTDQIIKAKKKKPESNRASDNHVRAQRVYGFVRRYQHDSHISDILPCLLCDVMHLCEISGMDFDDLLAAARRHFIAERACPHDEECYTQADRDMALGLLRAAEMAKGSGS